LEAGRFPNRDVLAPHVEKSGHHLNKARGCTGPAVVALVVFAMMIFPVCGVHPPNPPLRHRGTICFACGGSATGKIKKKSARESLGEEEECGPS